MHIGISCLLTLIGFCFFLRGDIFSGLILFARILLGIKCIHLLLYSGLNLCLHLAFTALRCLLSIFLPGGVSLGLFFRLVAFLPLFVLLVWLFVLAFVLGRHLGFLRILCRVLLGIGFFHLGFKAHMYSPFVIFPR